MRKKMAWPTVMVALAMLVAACAGGDAESTSTTESTTDTTEPGVDTTVPSTDTTEAAEDVASFYEGKTIRIIVGNPPGGGNDTTARLLAEHMGQYIPGEPRLTVDNFPGAGGLVAANTYFTTGETDGTVFMNVDQAMSLEQAVDPSAFEFNIGEIEWLGSLTSLPVVCVARADTGITSMSDLNPDNRLIVAASAPGSIPYDTPAVLNAALGESFDIVAGYDGSGNQRLAVEQGEVDGLCIGLIAPIRAWIEDGYAVPIVYIGEGDDDPALEGVDKADSLAETDQAEALIDAVSVPSRMIYAYALHPDVPAERIEALRSAFQAASQDPEFQAAMAEAALPVIAKGPDEVADLVGSVLALPEDILNAIREVRSE